MPALYLIGDKLRYTHRNPRFEEREQFAENRVIQGYIAWNQHRYTAILTSAITQPRTSVRQAKQLYDAFESVQRSNNVLRLYTVSSQHSLLERLGWERTREDIDFATKLARKTYNAVAEESLFPYQKTLSYKKSDDPTGI